MSPEKKESSELLTDQSIKAVAQSPALTISGVSERTIEQYFVTLNAEEYLATAQLFAADGVLQPPFESAITGRPAIVAYLEAEAKGMQLHPHYGSSQAMTNGNTEFKVMGNVQTPLLRVNVGWCLVLNSEAEIVLASVKLLAALEELLHLRRSE